MDKNKSLVTGGGTFQLTPAQKELIKKRIAPEATEDELALFFYTCEKRGLDPLLNQVYYVKRRKKVQRGNEWKWEAYHVIQTGIDGFRVIAERTGKLSGILSGAMKDSEGKLIGGWAEVYRKGWDKPVRIELEFSEYCQKDENGNATGQWKARPSFMIQKCAEAAALRRAFPEDLGGTYEPDEMREEQTGEGLNPLSPENIVETETIVQQDPPQISVAAVAQENTEEKDKALWTEIILGKKKELAISEKMFHDTLVALQPDATCDLKNATLPTLKALWERVKVYEEKKAKKAEGK